MTTLRTGQLALLATFLLLLCLTLRMAATASSDVCKTCHPNATCIERDHKYTCMCNFGLIGNGRSQCTDKDECQIGAYKICGEHTACHNTYGSYYCICLKGYRPTNNHENFIPNDGTFCTDIDECEVPDICGNNAKCKNIPGSYECYCNEGYQPRNSTEPFQANGDHSVCKAIDCGPPPFLPHSKTVLSDNTTFGSHVTYVCESGFLAEDGHNASICTVNGTWEGASLACKAFDCGKPPLQPKVHVDTITGTTFGSKVKYSCGDEFVAEHSHQGTASCSTKGSWNGALLKCKAIDCGVPQAPPNTVIQSFNGTVYGSEVTFMCLKGFIALSGCHTSVCNATGQWEGSSLVCEVADCGPPPIIQNATPTGLWNTTYGSGITFQCLSGYIIAGGNDTVSCNEDGEWDGGSLVCRELSCGQPPLLANTSIHWNGSTTAGSEVHYTCLNGFYNPDIWHVSRCTSNESWEQATFICKEVDCGIPIIIENADWMWNNQSTMGSYVSYKCKLGFKDNGEKMVSVCLENSTWEVLNLTCEVTEDLINNLKVFNETCLKWTKSSNLFGREILYKFSMFGIGKHDTNVLDENIFYYSTDDENPVVCLQLLSETNYTITMTAVSPEVPAVVLNFTIQTTMRHIFGTIALFNNSCLTWTRRVYPKETYTVSIQGKSWLPERLLQNIIFHFTTEERRPVLCLALPPAAEYIINITESSTKLSSYVTLNISESENAIQQRAFNETCLQWNRSLNGLQEIYILYVKGGRWSPEELLRNMTFNTDQNVTVACLDTSYHLNITTDLSNLAELTVPKIKIEPANSQLPKISFHRSDKNGYISSYQVFVIQHRTGCSFACEILEPVTYFSNISRSQGYVTAEFFPGDIPEHLEFLVGDRQYYGDFYNAPLEHEKDYCIILRTISKMRTHTCTVVAETEALSASRHHITVVLLGSIALLFFILLVSYSTAWIHSQTFAQLSQSSTYCLLF
ncbi:sushi domain-containing protein 1 [Gastrophryne carolinensis]